MAINNQFTRKYSEWIEQWKDKNVQDLNNSYDFVSSESTLLVSGPAEYTQTDPTQSVGQDVESDKLIPIGLVQNASIAQNKQIQQLNEVGSRQLFTIPGRTYAQANISRILFDGPSLLFAMNTFYTSAGDTSIYIPNVVKKTVDGPTLEYPATNTSQNGYTSVTQDVEMGGYWGNLGSSVFNKPLGLGFIFLDTESDFYGGIYLEKCYIASYNVGISAQQTILLENVVIRVTRVRPIRLSGAVA